MTNQEVRGKLKLNPNGCTERMRVQPIRGGVWYVVPEGGDQSFVSVVSFDPRQVWEVCFFNTCQGTGWAVEKNNLYLRMSEEDFERFFGRYKLVD